METHQRRMLNRKLKLDLDVILKEISHRSEYIHKYCYNLKFYTHSLHAVYRLLHKLLEIYGNDAVSQKCSYHNLIHGPRTISKNREILKSLLKYVDLQVNWLAALVNLNSNSNVQKKIHFVFMHVINFFNFLIWHDDITSEYTHNSIPVKLNFL